jgi:ABC transporter substrate binding protein (PQQ-dependent alcohol dehydrogenase system)
LLVPLLIGLTGDAAISAATVPFSKIQITYLGKIYDEPPPLSRLDKGVTDEGIAGGRLALRHNNATGRFLGLEFELKDAIVPTGGDPVEAAKHLLAKGARIIVADLKTSDLLAVADLAEAKNAIVFNTRSSDVSLRQNQCRANLFHVVPDWAMRADALAQYLIWKKWDRWFILSGVRSADRQYVAAIRRAAARFGGQIVEERTYKFETGPARSDTGHQQIQTQMPQATQGVGDHNVVWVADTDEAFGEYVPYRTYDPRPVVGNQGLIATAWHPAYESYAARQLQDEFEQFAKLEMTERDYTVWLAVRAAGEAAIRSGNGETHALRSYIFSESYTVAGFKGVGMSFRAWDHQLRQPLLITGPRSVVSLSPQEGFLHPKHLTDTLGYDRPESKCSFS